MGNTGRRRNKNRPRLSVVFGEAVEMLRESLQEEVSIRLLFKTKRRHLKDISPIEWNMIHRWVHEVLRWKLTIDILIEDAVQKRIANQRPLFVYASELLVYGIVWDDRPPSKMLNILKGFLNHHTIRTPRWIEDLAFSIQHIDVKRYKPGGGKIRALAFQYSLPIWYIKKTLQQLGETTALELFSSFSHEPTVRCFWTNPFNEDPLIVEKSLKEAEILFSKDDVLSNTYILSSPIEALFNHVSFKNHHLLFQDWGSIAIGQSLPIKKTDLVLDSAAAPGNKTLQLLAQNPLHLIAGDIRLQRTRLLKDRLRQYGALPRVGVIQYTGLRPCFSRQFDKVLLDAPCSGTGTFASRPELKWKVTSAQVTEFSRLQLDLLTSLSTQVKQGGMLLYATCSTLYEENEHVILSFLRTNPDWHLSDEIGVQLSDHSSLIKKTYRIFPSSRGAGFYFLALLEKG